MRVYRVVFPALISFLLITPASAEQAATAQAPATAQKPLRTPDVIFVPTPYEIVDAMLKLAKVGPNDVVYDLGSGDGRIPIAAVEKYNAKSAVGIDINPERITEAHANHAKSKAGNRVKFVLGDIFEEKIGEASVVTLYLLPSLNSKLIPKFKAELKPGTRIVSQSFDMKPWEPDQTIEVDGRSIYLWIVK